MAVAELSLCGAPRPLSTLGSLSFSHRDTAKRVLLFSQTQAMQATEVVEWDSEKRATTPDGDSNTDALVQILH